MKNINIKSKITCPYCGFEKEEEMPLCMYVCISMSANLERKYLSQKKENAVCFALTAV